MTSTAEGAVAARQNVTSRRLPQVHQCHSGPYCISPLPNYGCVKGEANLLPSID